MITAGKPSTENVNFFFMVRCSKTGTSHTQARELKDTKIGVCCLSILEIEREVKIQRETERDRLFIIEYFHIGNGDWEVKMYAGNCKMEQILVADRVIFIGRF